MNLTGTTETGNNREVENVLNAARVGYYLQLRCLWKNNSDDTYHFSYIGKIVANTLTQKGLFSTRYGNITIELANGKRFDVYEPQPAIRKSINAGGYSFKDVSRGINPVLKEELKNMLPFGYTYYFYSGDAHVLNPDILADKQVIVNDLNAMKTLQGQNQEAIKRKQEEDARLAAERAAREQALKAQMNGIDLDDLFHSTK